MAEFFSSSHDKVSPRQNIPPQSRSQRLSRTKQEEADKEKFVTFDEQPSADVHSFNPLDLRLPRSSSCPLPDSPAHLWHITTSQRRSPYSRLMSQYTYGSIPVTESEAAAMAEQNQHPTELIEEDSSCCPDLRRRVGRFIESKPAHVIILGLTIVDILLVILQIGASLLHLDETEEEVFIIELFEHLSLAIVSIFVLEIVLKLFTFGPKYFWKGTHHGLLHLLDAAIILVSFFLEIFAKSVEAKELGSLLIIFRLWRVIKLTSTVAIEVNEHDDVKIRMLTERIHQLEQELAESQAQVERLRQYTPDQV